MNHRLTQDKHKTKKIETTDYTDYTDFFKFFLSVTSVFSVAKKMERHYDRLIQRNVFVVR
jgi:hypothetical protein